MNHFKSFNDHYGFRQGDRVILLLSSLLQEIFWGESFFIGHIGGDDFFVGARFNQDSNTLNTVIQCAQEVLLRFSHDVLAFYDEAARQKGYIEDYDREGKKRRFPLLSVTVVMVTLPSEQTLPSAEFLSQTVARLKKHAKDNGIACIIYPNNVTENNNPTSTLQTLHHPISNHITLALHG
ncbi:MAG: diguanylate cyclase domain-containing protein [Candidatus Caldatribacteriaceae bacterium]